MSALVAIHAMTAGSIEHHKQEIQRIVANLGHVAATLKLLAPGHRPGQHRRPAHASIRIGSFEFFKLVQKYRLILNILREAGQLMLTADIIGSVIARKKLENGTGSASAPAAHDHGFIAPL
jgi:hypothetical protein